MTSSFVRQVDTSKVPIKYNKQAHKRYVVSYEESHVHRGCGRKSLWTTKYQAGSGREGEEARQPRRLSTCNWVRYHSHLSFFSREISHYSPAGCRSSAAVRSIPRRSLVCNRKTGKGAGRKKSIYLSPHVRRAVDSDR